ncbi:MAG: amino acid ABC transporter substrate-binding protein [Salinisphaera sp.]|jgi:branched-chain amino acid transport system substrate-binding protein|nr:amino acid ABC transporter substrate-binding protein [Salinisphaera sp.]
MVTSRGFPRFLALVAAIAATMLFITSAQAQDKRDFYKVGVITSLSGAMVYGGNVTRRGYDLWEQQVNKNGGIEVGGKKYKVKLVYADAQSNPQSAADAVQRMISRDNVDFILGPYASSSTLGAAPITERYKVPMITGSAESPSIWARHFKYTFGAVPAVDRTAGEIMTVLAKQRPEIKTVSIIGMNDPFSKSTAEALRDGAKKAGFKVLSYDITPPDADMTPLISKARSLKPDVLAVGGEPNNHIAVVKAMESLSYKPKGLVMHYGVNTPDFQKAVGKAANYVIGATVWDPSLPYKDAVFGTAQNYVKLSETRYNVKPDYTQAASSAAGEAFAAALNTADLPPPLSAADKVKLVDALENVRIKTFYGTIGFEKQGPWYHDNAELKPIVTQMIDGKQVLVGPGDLGTQKIVYPQPSGQ